MQLLLVGGILQAVLCFYNQFLRFGILVLGYNPAQPCTIDSTLEALKEKQESQALVS
jgi:hypothetical protein